MIWIVGSKGMAGKEFAKQLTQHKIPWIGTDSEIDITDYQKIESFKKNLETSAYYPSALPHAQRKIQWIINCCEYCDLEKAEENIELCNKINVDGAKNLAALCRNTGCKLIQISSAYVYDGAKNTSYTEQDSAKPINVYGSSKLQAENEISRLMNTYYIIRTSALYGDNESDSDYIKTILDTLNNCSETAFNNHSVFTPTYCGNLVDTVIKLIEKSENATSLFGKNSAPNYGIYNFSDSGTANNFDLGKAVYKFGKKSGKIKNECKIILDDDSYSETEELYPENLVLNKEKICKSLKIKIPNWENSLEKYIKSLSD